MLMSWTTLIRGMQCGWAGPCSQAVQDLKKCTTHGNNIMNKGPQSAAITQSSLADLCRYSFQLTNIKIIFLNLFKSIQGKKIVLGVNTSIFEHLEDKKTPFHHSSLVFAIFSS